MSRRTERVANLIRQIIGQVVLSKLSDPRIDPARTSITRAEVPEDLLTAKVFVSVIGTDADERRTIRALQHAAGRIQELIRQQVSLQHTPVLSFEIDTRYKKTMQTLEIIQQAMDEIHQKEAADEQRTADDDPGRTDGLVPQTGPAEEGRPRRDGEAG